MRKFTIEERRARLSRRHHLAPPNRATSATEVARDILGLHSTDPATVFVAAWARMKNAEVAGIEHELYEERSLVRVLVLRLLAVDGRLMRGRPRGGWLSTQWSWFDDQVVAGQGAQAMGHR